MKMKWFLAVAAVIGFSTPLGLAQAVRVTPAATVVPAPVHHPVKRKPVQPIGSAKLHRGNNNVTGQTVHPPVQAQALHRGVPPVRPPVINYEEAFRRHHRERHDRFWWRSHYATIVFVTGGYYYWDAGYWFPAWGYDPSYDSYDYDGPIYTYGNLLPDQVIINVQRALQQLGYYTGSLTGSLGPATRAAIAAYQQDAGLTVTGGVDAPTVEALGLY